MAKPHTQPSSTTSTSTTTSTTNNSSSSSSSYYNRLLHQCTKQLHKQVKKTKTFVLQKAIRKNKKNSNAKIEQRIQEIKDLDINLVVQEALHRLGIYKLNPNETDAATTTTPRSSSNPLLLEQIFSHTHMQTAMEEWNQQVSNFHRWSLRQHPNDNSQELSPSNVVLPNASVFYHPASSSFTTTTTTTLHNKKKNRMGQRARRAKALAQEQTHSSSSTTNHHPVSTNWRTKTKPPHSNITTTTTTGTQQHQDDNNSLHPSWQARKQDKNNIVPFQGTKITF